mgnify:FL=1
MNKNGWTKETFLGELREYLSVLEDREQEDILEEYSQHIDMKMQKGLSEEEAIRDFGSVKELAAEILEAYHVKPGFRQQKTGFCLPGMHPGGDGGKESAFWDKAKLLKIKSVAVFRRVLDAIRHGFAWMGQKCRQAAGWFKKPFQIRGVGTGMEDSDGFGNGFGSGSGRRAGNINGNEKEADAVWAEAAQCPLPEGVPAAKQSVWQASDRIRKEKGSGKGTKDMAGSIGMFFRKAGKGLAAVWGWFLYVCIWLLRLWWNMAWLLFSLFCAAIGMLVLAGSGTMLVLLFQGYPLLGLLLIGIGGILCFGSLAGLAYSLVIRKKKGENTVWEKEPEGSGKEVQYE